MSALEIVSKSFNKTDRDIKMINLSKVSIPIIPIYAKYQRDKFYLRNLDSVYLEVPSFGRLAIP